MLELNGIICHPTHPLHTSEGEREGDGGREGERERDRERERKMILSPNRPSTLYQRGR